MELKSNLKKLRLKNGLTQDELGKKIGLSSKVISKWEGGYSLPDIDNIKKLCAIFNCEYADLIGPEKINKAKKVKEEKSVTKKEIKINKQNVNVLKKISNVLYVFTKIYQVLLCIAVVVVVLGIVFIPSIISKVKVDSNTISVVSFNGDVISVTGEDILLKGDYILKYNDRVIDKNINFDVIKNVADVFRNSPVSKIVFQIELILAFVLISLVVSVVAVYHLESFFKNIRDEEVLFNQSKINNLAMATGLFIGMYVCDLIVKGLIENFISTDIYSGVSLIKIAEIMFMIIVVYVFKYGHDLEKNKIEG